MASTRNTVVFWKSENGRVGHGSELISIKEAEEQIFNRSRPRDVDSRYDQASAFEFPCLTYKRVTFMDEQLKAIADEKNPGQIKKGISLAQFDPFLPKGIMKELFKSFSELEQTGSLDTLFKSTRSSSPSPR
jgi:hypothetical protein